MHRNFLECFVFKNGRPRFAWIMNARSAVIETKAMLNTNKYHMAIIEEGTGQLIHATSPARQGGLLIIYLFFIH